MTPADLSAATDTLTLFGSLDRLDRCIEDVLKDAASGSPEEQALSRYVWDRLHELKAEALTKLPALAARLAERNAQERAEDETNEASEAVHLTAADFDAWCRTASEGAIHTAMTLRKGAAA